ncbi:GroES-like protein [Clavulina sp. PMI_390]|nr:GroES-like protein [Clavulina sp. PMI_390]
MPSLPEKMKAAIVAKYSKDSPAYELVDVPLPPSFHNLLPYQILIKVAVASFCHTDLQILEGDGPAKPGVDPSPSQLAGSHEPTGVIVQLGSDAATKGGFKLGDRIAAAGGAGMCDTCEDCTMTYSAEGSPVTLKYNQHCAHQSGFVGVWTLPGAFQEYTLVDYRFAVRLPDNMTFADAAPLTCAGLTAFRALQVARAQSQPPLKEDDWIAVLGSGGGLGHLLVQFAKAVNLKVIGIDARSEGLELTRRARADVTIDALAGGNDGVVKAVQAATGGRGVSASIILTEHPTASATACAITKTHGTAVIVALPADGVRVPYGEFIFRDVRLFGSNIGSSEDMQALFDLVGDQKNEIFVEKKVFDGLESLPEVIGTYKRAKVAGKLVVRVDSTVA